jgi:hypothetical protein
MRRIIKELVFLITMNLGITAVVIGILFVILKFGVNYKENPAPDLKDGAIAAISALAGLYAIDVYSQKISKSVEVFTDKPAF